MDRDLRVTEAIQTMHEKHFLAPGTHLVEGGPQAFQALFGRQYFVGLGIRIDQGGEIGNVLFDVEVVMRIPMGIEAQSQGGTDEEGFGFLDGPAFVAVLLHLEVGLLHQILRGRAGMAAAHQQPLDLLEVPGEGHIAIG